MQITSNFNKDAEAAKEAPKTEVFEGHNVVGGKVQPTWGEWIARSDISPVQVNYDTQKSAAADKEAYSWNPLTMVKNTLSWILDAFKSLFCYGAKEDAVEEADATKKETVVKDA